MKMRNVQTDLELDICEHYILKNFWEYYIVSDRELGSIRLALVEGFEQELGDVDLEEIQPYIISTCSENELSEIAPAPGWEWVSDV